MDEAGLGPNFGPFVSALTVWDVPSRPKSFNFWRTFAEILTNAPEPNDTRLHVADSKMVFQPQRGYAALERGVLSALRLLGHAPNCFEHLCRLLSADDDSDSVPPKAHWYDAVRMDLP